MIATTVVCGVDAGGSKTDCVLARADGTVLSRKIAGGTSLITHPRFTDVIADVVRLGIEGAGISRDEVGAYAIGLTGVDTSERVELATAALAGALGSQRVVVRNDADIALEGATLSRPGAVLMAGTGSICYGEDRDGRRRRVGGWGHVLGDEGSGFAVSVAALAAVLRAVDGRAPRTALLDRALRHFALDDLRRLVELTDQFASEPHSAAGFAPHVLELAEAGDPLAAPIVRAAGNELADLALEIIDTVGSDGRCVVAFGGGLLANSGYYASLVRARIQDVCPVAEIRPFEMPPVGGAVLVALGTLEAARNFEEPRSRLGQSLQIDAVDAATARSVMT